MTDLLPLQVFDPNPLQQHNYKRIKINNDHRLPNVCH